MREGSFSFPFLFYFLFLFCTKGTLHKLSGGIGIEYEMIYYLDYYLSLFSSFAKYIIYYVPFKFF